MSRQAIIVTAFVLLLAAVFASLWVVEWAQRHNHQRLGMAAMAVHAFLVALPFSVIVAIGAAIGWCIEKMGKSLRGGG